MQVNFEFVIHRYILPNHMLLQICGILPREKQGVLACCNPIPPLVRQYLNEIHAIIAKARESPLHKVIVTKNSCACKCTAWLWFI